MDRLKKDQTRGAQRELLEELFNDHYRYKWRVYQVNFVRGIFFGLGSVIGASLIVGVVIWLLSLFTDLPVIGDFVEQSQSSIENQQR